MKQTRKQGRAPEGILSHADCQINIYQEKIPDCGEDACRYAMNAHAILVGVFDGCGGAGAKHYPRLQGKTGAYVASRLVSGTVKDWFEACCARGTGFSPQELKRRIQENLQMCHQVGGEESRFVSSMVKSFPTTAALAVCSMEGSFIRADCFWAGDSRVYLLNGDGLAQLSEDDLAVADAMDNLYEDGAMTNVISRNKDFILHHGTVILDQPGILFAATDGCFGYLHSPMEFEYLLTRTLAASGSIDQWERALHGAIGQVAGDDYALSAISLDFGSFQAMKDCLTRREAYLREHFLVEQSRGREALTLLWNQYKPNYYRISLLTDESGEEA